MGESVAVACLDPGAILLCRFADCRVLRHSRHNCANESMCALSSLGHGRLALVGDMRYASVQVSLCCLLSCCAGQVLLVATVVVLPQGHKIRREDTRKQAHARLHVRPGLSS